MSDTALALLAAFVLTLCAAYLTYNARLIWRDSRQQVESEEKK